MKKALLFIMLLVFLVSQAESVTEFDDGTPPYSGYTNFTKQVTLSPDKAIKNATLTITGTKTSVDVDNCIHTTTISDWDQNSSFFSRVNDDQNGCGLGDTSTVITRSVDVLGGYFSYVNQTIPYKNVKQILLNLTWTRTGESVPYHYAVYNYSRSDYDRLLTLYQADLDVDLPRGYFTAIKTQQTHLLYICNEDNVTMGDCDNYLDGSNLMKFQVYINDTNPPASADFRLQDHSLIIKNRDYPKNVTVKVGNLIVYNNSGYLNSSINIDLNKTYITSYIQSVSTLPLSFSSMLIGGLNLTNLDIDNSFDITLNFTSSTTGVIQDLDKSKNFSGTGLAYDLADLATGRVNVMFNEDGQGNFTQFYEFSNSGVTAHITENITLLTSYDQLIYFRVVDFGNSPLKDVVLRNNNINAGAFWTVYQFIGQRLTNDDGRSYIIYDSGKQTYIDISKEGYRTQTILLTPSLVLGNTQDNPIVVYLEDSDDGLTDGNQIYITKEFVNRSNDINGLLYAPSRDTVKIITDYRISQSLGNKTLTDDELDRYSFSLVSGTDFSSSGSDDIVLYIYIDGLLWDTKTITFNSDTRTEIYEPTDSLDSSTVKIMYAIGIVFLATLLNGIRRQGDVFEGVDVGFHIFMVGGIIAPLFSISFLWLSLICTLYYLFKGLFKNINIG